MTDINHYRYIFAGVLTVVVFLLGVFMSGQLDDARVSALENSIEKNNVELQSTQMQLNYLRSENVQDCDVLEAGLQDIVASYNKRLSSLQTYQEDSLLKGQEFETLKRSYILSGIRYWMFAEEINRKCGRTSDTVLYFTSRVGAAETCEACAEMGEHLSLAKKERGSDVLIFTVPANLDDGMVEMLKQQYNVTSIPTTVFNSNRSSRIEGVGSLDQIGSKLEG